MKLSYRTPKLYNLKGLLKVFRSEKLCYSIHRFKGERANRIYSLISIPIDDSKWLVEGGTVSIRSEEIKFPDVRLTKQNHKRFKEFLLETKADLFMPQTHADYMENRVELASELLLICVLEDQSGPRKISDPFQDWGIRTDRELKARLIQLKKAEGEPLESSGPAEDIDANLTVEQDEVVDESYVRKALAKQMLTQEKAEEKLRRFKGGPKSFLDRLKEMAASVNSKGVPVVDAINEALENAALDLAGTELEKICSMEYLFSEKEQEQLFKIPDFIENIKLKIAQAGFKEKTHAKKMAVLTKELEKKVKEYSVLKGVDASVLLDEIKEAGIVADLDPFEANDKLEGLLESATSFFMSFWTRPEYEGTRRTYTVLPPLESYVNNEGVRVMYLNVPNHGEEYLRALEKLRAYVGDNPDLLEEIRKVKEVMIKYTTWKSSQTGIFWESSHTIPSSIFDLNRTAENKELEKRRRDLTQSFEHITPIKSEDFTYNKVSNAVTSPQYPGLTIFVGGDHNELINPKEVYSAAFFSLDVVSKYTAIRHIAVYFKGGERFRASYWTKSQSDTFDSHKISNGEILNSRYTTPQTMAHEVMHAIEHHNPSIPPIVTAFYAGRVEPDHWRHTQEGGEPGFDCFADHYTGKIYRGENVSTELLTTGIEMFVDPKQIPTLASRDYTFFLLIYSLVTGKLRDYL